MSNRDPYSDSFEFGAMSVTPVFLRHTFTAYAASPPVEAVPATISPMVAKQNGHIVHLPGAAQLGCRSSTAEAASIVVTGEEGSFRQRRWKKLSPVYAAGTVSRSDLRPGQCLGREDAAHSGVLKQRISHGHHGE